MKVNIKKKHLSVAYKDSNGEWVQAMDGALTWDIRVEEAIWSLVPGEHIHVSKRIPSNLPTKYMV